MLPVVFAPYNFKQTVERFCFAVSDLAHSFCGSSGRSGKENLELALFIKRKNTVESCCFSGAGAARQHKKPFFDRRHYGKALLFFKFNILLFFYFVNVLFNGSALCRRKTQHNLNSVCNIFFGKIH